MRQLSDIEAYLYRNIPLTEHMGVRLLAYENNSVRLFAPLKMNVNHESTAFGGSLSSLGILAGWVLLLLKCREESLKPRLVIQNSQSNFIKAVESDFEAECCFADLKDWQKFISALKRFGRARVALNTEVYAEQILAVKHSGLYVAIIDD